MSQQGPGGQRGGRYQRSFGGLIGSMIVIVALVLAFVVWRGLFRDLQELGRPEPVDDYLGLVGGLQEAGFPPVYPATLPDGWIVSEVTAEPSDPPAYRFNLFTDDDQFVGIRQSSDDVDDLVAQHVDDDAEEADPATGVGGDGTPSTWEGWSDEDGDHAFSTTVDDSTVLVYGGVSAEVLRELLPLLSVAPVPEQG